MNYDLKECGKRIQQLRIRRNYSQQQLAKELNIDRSHLSHIESGERGSSLDLLVQFSEFFHVSPDYIVLGKSEGNLWNFEKREQLKCELSDLIGQLKAFQSAL